MRLALLATVALLTACAAPSPRPAPEARTGAKHESSRARAAAPSSTLVREAFITGLSQGDNIDSVATWSTPDGDLWLIATAKDSGRLIVFDGDTGATLQTFGRPGSEAGNFLRPNGIAVFGDFAFVVERDNHRVQVLHLPGFEPAGMFGADVLLKPYGLWLHESAPQELRIDVTDSYQAAGDALPARAELDRRVKRFRVALDESGIEDARLEASYGDTSEAGAVYWIESIVGDPLHDRWLIPEEYIDLEPGAIRVYDGDGRFRGANVGRGLFGGQPEGLALYDCPDGSGYWIATDQQLDFNRFHVFERRSLEHIGTFHGEIVRFTDGVALHAVPSARFPAGAFYAVHHDQGVVAFDWRDVAGALGLKAGCAD